MCKHNLRIVRLSLFFIFNLVLTLSNAFNLSKEICVEDLHIFNILTNAKVILMEDLLKYQNNIDDKIGEVNETDKVNATCEINQPSKVSQPEKLSLSLVEQEITLLQDIVNGFNRGRLIFIEYRFLSICNFLKNLNTIEPKSIRAFRRKIVKFNEFLNDYSVKKKDDLDKEEILLCEKIKNFNTDLLKYFLRHDFYDIDLFDEVTDYCFFRPVEWMGDHPLITTSLFLIIASCLFYHYVWPHFGNYSDAMDETIGADGSKVLDSKNPDVIQIRTFFQSGSTCGAHAAFKIIAFHESGGDIEKAHALANDKVRFAKLEKEWGELAAIKKDEMQDLNNLEDIHIQAILNDYNDKNPQNKILPESYTVISDIAQLDAYSEFNRAGDPDLVKQWKILLEGGAPLYFVVNTRKCGEFKEPTEKDGSACSPDKVEKAYAVWIKKNQRAVGHWLPFMVIPSNGDGDHVKFLTADSLHNGNRTNCEWVRRLHKMLVK